MKVKISNMCLIRNGEQIVVQKRTKKDWPGLTFPGGKLEKNESIYESCIREVKEETGLVIDHLQLKGIIHYELADEEERWIIYLFETNCSQRKLEVNKGEDEVFWMNYKDLKNAELSNDLDVYMKVYEDDSIMEAHSYWQDDQSVGFTFF